MRELLFFVIVIALLGALGLIRKWDSQDQGPGSMGPQTVYLKDGTSISGEVTLVADGYRVQMPDHAETVVARENVARMERSMLSYVTKRYVVIGIPLVLLATVLSWWVLFRRRNPKAA